MIEAQIENIELSPRSKASRRTPAPISQLFSIDWPKVSPSLVRGVWSRLIRQAYGVYKLVFAPSEAYCLIAARSDTVLGRLVAEPGRKRALASQPFVCAEWSGARRLRRMIEHCAVIEALGHPFAISGDQYVEIISFELGSEPCRLMLDQPTWLECDGLLSASLWAGYIRVFTVSFCLSDSAAGRTAYVGGIQGNRSDEALDQNRALTKAAHGMRPRDLVFELFRLLLPQLGVTQLKCVANASRYQMTRRARMTIGAADQALLDYDEIWETRGGLLGNDGFFLVPTAYSRRDTAEIPAKKRSMYRGRYALLDRLETDIGLALQNECTILTH